MDWNFNPKGVWKFVISAVLANLKSLKFILENLSNISH